MAHPVERELIEASGYKARRKFDDRQDYLSSILNSVMKLSDDDFDNLTDEATEWANAAVEARNSKQDIPDFDEVIEEVPLEADEDEDETEEDPDDEGDDAETDNDDAEDDDEDDTDDADGDDTAAVTAVDSVGRDEEVERGENPRRGTAKAATSKPSPKKPVKAAASKKPAKRSSDDEDVVLDKWGCMEGSKNSCALALFEKGATAREVKEVLGGTYYNILKKCVENGHTLEKDGAIIKIIHKDEKVKKAPSKKAKK